MTRPNFAVAADETPYRRLGAALREEIYRLQQSSYSFGVQSESGLVRLDVAQTALGASRDRIYSKIESLLMLVDVMAEMKDVNVTQKGEGHAFKPERRSRAKVKEVTTWESEPETTGAPLPSATKAVDTAKTTDAPAVPSQAQSSALESATNLAANPHRELTPQDMTALTDDASMILAEVNQS